MKIVQASKMSPASGGLKGYLKFEILVATLKSPDFNMIVDSVSVQTACLHLISTV